MSQVDITGALNALRGLIAINYQQLAQNVAGVNKGRVQLAFLRLSNGHTEYYAWKSVAGAKWVWATGQSREHG